MKTEWLTELDILQNLFETCLTDRRSRGKIILFFSPAENELRAKYGP